MIKLSKTYSVVCPEVCDIVDSGFIFQDVPYTFREALELIESEGFIYPSTSHGTPRWISSGQDLDPSDGQETEYSLHPGDTPKDRRRWAKLMAAAGINQ